MKNSSLGGVALVGLSLSLSLLASPIACAPAAPDPTVDEPFGPLARVEATAPTTSSNAANPPNPPAPRDGATDPLQDAGADASEDGGDASLDASPDAWADGGTVVATGELPLPIPFRRIAYVGPRPNPPAGACPAGSSTSTPLAFNALGSCCYTETASAAGTPVTVTLSAIAGSERVCLVGGSTSACALVDATGLATFAESPALEALYNRWNLNYRSDHSSTTLSVQLSPARDRATVTLQISARTFGSGCGAGQGAYMPRTVREVTLR